MRVAFTKIGGDNWKGGINYLFNLLTALTKYQKNKITPILFVSNFPDDDLNVFYTIPGVDVVRTSLLNGPRRQRSLVASLLLGRDRPLQLLFQEYQIDIVFESAQFFGWRLGIPTISWFPDLQHKCLPHLFSRGAWWKREIGFRTQIWSGRTIMLSSNDARKTCEKFYPASRFNTHTVHFAVPPGPSIKCEDARKVADEYGLPQNFFFMPNQFWRHKNHELVLDALHILKQRGKSIVIAASGKQTDPRDPTYFPALKAKLEKSELQDMLILLGLIPYHDVAMLMRASGALLNPSQFEGWSTTVEEARNLGTPMILSDLDVHREQMGNNAIYFDRQSTQNLADTLENFQSLTPDIRTQMAIVARQNSAERFEQFAKDFGELCKSCQK